MTRRPRPGRLPALAWALATVAAGCGALPIDAFSLAPGARECIGVPRPTCEELAARQHARPGPGFVAFRIRCTSPTCTAEAGNAEVMLLLVDGTTEIGSAFWVGE